MAIGQNRLRTARPSMNCHPERSEGPVARGKIRSLASLGMTKSFLIFPSTLGLGVGAMRLRLWGVPVLPQAAVSPIALLIFFDAFEQLNPRKSGHSVCVT